jgi:hypothetical protein
MEEEDDDECRYSCVLVLSAFAQLVLYLVAIVCTIQALQEGSIFKVFEIEEVGFWSKNLKVYMIKNANFKLKNGIN